MKRWLSFFAAVAMLPVPEQGMAQTKSKLAQTLERGTLPVGTTCDFNPLSMNDTAISPLTGFDVEVLTA